MTRYRTGWLLAVCVLLILGCAEKPTQYPWIYDELSSVETHGKLVGYEFWAQW